MSVCIILIPSREGLFGLQTQLREGLSEAITKRSHPAREISPRTALKPFANYRSDTALPISCTEYYIRRRSVFNQIFARLESSRPP